MQELKIYNTLSGKKEKLKPIKAKKLNLFVCGITVYDYAHIGHARSYIFFDAFVKYLRHIGYNVFYLQNITDLDDKIIVRAREKGVLPKDLAKAFEKECLKDMKILGINSVSKYARATNYIKEITSQTKRLQDKGFAYKIEDDGIYYDISKFKTYGKLAGRTALDAEDSVSRIDYSKDKKNRGDFCIWKFAQSEEEPQWKSPFGNGRPGWHIEDTAIAEKFFGVQYDIHGGGRDLIFPHHEAEISQMEALSGKSPMAKYWMHTGFLTVSGQKMSKSLGNFITIKDFVKRYSVNYLRFFVLKNLWSSPLDYSESIMVEIKLTLERIEEFLRRLKAVEISKDGKEVKNIVKIFKQNFYNELNDNFNTPKAFAVIFDFIKSTNELLDKSLISRKQANEIYRFFEEANEIFGIINFKKINKVIPIKIKKLALSREEFRKSQQWDKADFIRKEIEKNGFEVEDTKDGPMIKAV